MLKPSFVGVILLAVAGFLQRVDFRYPATRPVMSSKVIAVVGTVNSDNTLIVQRVPDPGESVRAQNFKQSCGGKGANSAIASFRSSRRCVQKEVQSEEGKEEHQFVKAYDEFAEIEVRLIARDRRRRQRQNMQSKPTGQRH